MEIDALPTGTAPFNGETLRSYYRDRVSLHGVDAAIADAEHRYQKQLQGNILPLAPQEQNGHGAGVRFRHEEAEGNDDRA